MPKPASRVATALAVGLLSSALPWAALTANAATVTACPSDQAGLVAAISGAGSGGTVAFGCDASITLGSTVALSNVSLDGNGHRVTVSGNHSVQAFTVAGTATLAGLDIVDGNAAGPAGYGGAVRILPGGALTVTGSTLSGNQAYFGGAISNQGSLTVVNSTFRNNSATFGGAIGGWDGANTTIADSSLNANAASGGGGAVWSQFGTLTVTRSTLSSNTGRGGGAVETRGSTTTISNSTLSGNTAATAGGGVSIAGGTFVMVNTTLDDNTTPSSGRSLYSNGAAVVTVTNSIMAGGGGAVPNCLILNSTFTGVGGNFATDGTCPGSSQVTAGALNLGPLADNGGPTQTRALLAGSAAIGAGVASACAAAPIDGRDQRGQERGATSCDSGAYDTGATPTPADTTPPVIEHTVTGTMGGNGWYTGDTVLAWTIIEAESADSLNKTGCVDQNITSDQQSTSYSCAATSTGGSTDPDVVTIKLDATAPVVTVTGVTDGQSYLLGSVPPAGCSTSDATSGVDTEAAPSSSGGPVGTITTTCGGAKDNAGNTGSATASYTVAYLWTGFRSPIDNDTANVVKAGGAVPVTFSLAGNQGLGAITKTTSMGVACGASPTDTSVIATVAAGQSALSYDPVTDTYRYVWKTDKSWAGTCRQLNVTLADGTSHQADFVLR